MLHIFSAFWIVAFFFIFMNFVFACSVTILLTYTLTAVLKENRIQKCTLNNHNFYFYVHKAFRALKT